MSDTSVREASLLLAGATLEGGRRVDVALVDGTIAEVGEPGSVSHPAGAKELDLRGYLLLPAPAEPHAHFDTALTADRLENPRGDLDSAIDAWMGYQAGVTEEDFANRATRAALLGLSNGTTAIRTHVGIYPQVGLRAVEALLKVREALSDHVDLQLVALTTALTGRGNADIRAMLRDALEMGVDVVGGCPHLDESPAACNELTLALATEFGRPIDLHTDETLDPGMLYLRDFARRVRDQQFPFGASASHCVSLGVQPEEVARQVAAEVAAAGITVICNPQTNLFLQARDVRSAPPRGLTAVRPLLEAGATVAGGGDNLRDPFNVLGRADPMETASLLVTAGHLTPAEAYRAVSAGARTAMGLPVVTVEAGAPAELLAVQATSTADAIASITSRLVIRRGKVAARTTVTRTPVDAPADAVLPADLAARRDLGQ